VLVLPLVLLLVLLVVAAVVGSVLIVGREYLALRRSVRLRCPSCGLAGHSADADYCKRCGSALTVSRSG
jgi:hypothetical protein